MDGMEEEALIFSQSSSTAKDWVTLLCDSSRTGGLGIQALRAPKRARWRLHVGNSVRSAPIFRGETLYVASLSGGLHAIDVQSGRTRWTFLAGDQIHSTPSFCGNMVLFGCDDGKVYAVDDNTGTKVWEAAARSEEHTSELQSPCNLVCRLLLEKKKKRAICNVIRYKTSTLHRQQDYDCTRSLLHTQLF